MKHNTATWPWVLFNGIPPTPRGSAPLPHSAPMRSSLSTAMLVSLLAGAGAASGQAEATLTPGDVVRVNHDFVGTLMSIDGETTLTVMGEGRPVCWPGIGHGDAPRCEIPRPWSAAS